MDWTTGLNITLKSKLEAILENYGPLQSFRAIIYWIIIEISYCYFAYIDVSLDRIGLEVAELSELVEFLSTPSIAEMETSND